MISVKAKTLVKDLMCVTGGDPAEWTTAYENLVEYVGDIEEELEDSRKSDECFNAVIEYMLGKGYMESPLEFLRCWNEGDFDALREEWPDAPEEIYLADPLYKGSLK